MATTTAPKEANPAAISSASVAARLASSVDAATRNLLEVHPKGALGAYVDFTDTGLLETLRGRVAAGS